MCEITMTIPDESLAAVAPSPEEAGAELRMLAAVKLFELKKLSSGVAARLAGVSRVQFLKLSRLCSWNWTDTNFTCRCVFARRF